MLTELRAYTPFSERLCAVTNTLAESDTEQNTYASLETRV